LYSIEREVNNKDVASMRMSFIESMYNSMLGARISEKVQKGDKNLLRGGAGKQGLVRGYDCFVVQAINQPNCGVAAFESVYQEVERAKRFGFNQSELDRLKKNMLSSLENNYKQKDKISNRSYVNEIKDIFMEDGVSMSIEYYTPLAKSLIENITINDVNELAKTIFTKENMVLIVQGPSEGVTHPTKEELLAVMDRVEKSDLAKYKDETTGQELLSEDELKGSKIVKVEKLPLLNAEKWTLENGTNVYYAKADFTKDNITLGSSSYGGTSVYGVDKLFVAGIAHQVMPAFGLGDFDAIALKKALAGKRVGVGVNVSSYSESISGASNKADFETMLKLVYLQFVKPRFDAEQLKIIMDRSAVQLATTEGTPNKIISDSASLISTNYHPRTIIATPDMFREITIEDVEFIYRDRFKDAASFDFFLVGDIEADEAKPLIEKYIGSLPNVDRKESWVDNKVRPAKGTTARDIDIKFETPKAVISVAYHRQMKAEAANILKNTILRGILDLRYTTNIREKEGGTYGVSVRAGFSRIPVQKATMSMQFECDPDKAEHLKSLIYKEIEEIKANGVTQDEVDNIVKNLIKNREQGVKSNNYVRSALIGYVQTGVDDTDPKNFDEILNKITPKDIQKYAKVMFSKKTDIVDLMFRTK
jgi:zinc protease